MSVREFGNQPAPHAELRDAVVAAAMAFWKEVPACDDMHSTETTLREKVNALRAAEQPDALVELRQLLVEHGDDIGPVANDMLRCTDQALRQRKD